MVQHVIDRAMQVHGGEGIDGVSLLPHLHRLLLIVNEGSTSRLSMGIKQNFEIRRWSR